MEQQMKLPEKLPRFRHVFAVRIRVLLCLTTLILGNSVSEAKCDFKGIFNFGDSNTDTGGYWAAFPPLVPPNGMTYFNKPSGRACDGRIIIDFLAQAMGLPFLSPYLESIGSDYKHGVNFATYASTVLPPKNYQNIPGVSPFSLAIQLNQMKEFKSKLLHQNPSEYLPRTDIFEKSLYTIYIGQNDFTMKVPFIGIDGMKQYLPQVVNQTVQTIKELYSLGGRSFLVLNIGPIGCYPAFIVLLPHNTSDLDMFGCMVSYNNAVSDYNKMLKDAVSQTRETLPGASIIYVDVYSIYLELYRHPTSHGFKYTTKACCGHGDGPYNFDVQLFCGHSEVVDGKTLTAKSCPDPENYVNWDGFHGTEASNKLVTRAILNGSYFDPPFPFHELCDLHLIE